MQGLNEPSNIFLKLSGPRLSGIVGLFLEIQQDFLTLWPFLPGETRDGSQLARKFPISELLLLHEHLG